MNTSRRVTVSVIFTMAVLILAVVALQDYHFDGRNYRQDEMILVHNGYAESISRVVQLGGINAGHPLGWQIVTTIWIKSTGYAEPAARHLSTLVTMITLALVFRFGSDLVDWQTGLYATFILGTLAFGMFYMHEFRPNPALVMATIGMEFAFLRWSYHPGFKYALLYVIFGVIGLQSHYFACYVLAAQAVRFVLLVRWNKPIYLRAFGLFAAVGLSACAWILPFIARMLTTGGQSNVLASNARFFEIVYQQMQIRPTALGYLLLP